MNDKERAVLAVNALKEKYPHSLCSLNAENPLQLIIATRLSAQCTDARVNLVTPALFAKYKTVEDFAAAEVTDVEEIIHSCGFFRAKARDIIGMCQKMISDFGGNVPDNIDDLTSLPGVGRKTANLIMGEVAPSGRLPVTFPQAVGQIPMYYNKKNSGRPTANPILYDDIPVGAAQFSIGADSYWLEYGDQPLYPFGYGLTYTTFEYSPVTLSDTLLSISNTSATITASCVISNMGSREAVAVPQLYIRDLVGSLTRPIRELKGFQRISIPAGESCTVRFDLTADDLAYWHLATGVTLGAEGAYTFSAEPGDFHIWIAPNAAEGTHATFTLQ